MEDWVYAPPFAAVLIAMLFLAFVAGRFHASKDVNRLEFLATGRYRLVMGRELSSQKPGMIFRIYNYLGSKPCIGEGRDLRSAIDEAMATEKTGVTPNE